VLRVELQDHAVELFKVAEHLAELGMRRLNFAGQLGRRLTKPCNT
jgi:hypothetical protein